MPVMSGGDRQMVGRLVAPFGCFAHARHDLVGRRVQRRSSASAAAARCRASRKQLRHPARRPGHRRTRRCRRRTSASRRCGLKGGILAERSDTVSDRLPAMRTNGRTRTTSWLPTRLIVETRITWRANVGSSAVGRRSLLCVAFVSADAKRAAQRDFDALWQRREIGLAVERRENGAAHKSSAAKCGQDRAGKPLHRNATAIDESARPAVDRQWRFVAELDGVGLP